MWIIPSAIPRLYPKIEAGVLPLGGSESEMFSDSANLSGLPAIFYDETPGAYPCGKAEQPDGANFWLQSLPEGPRISQA